MDCKNIIVIENISLHLNEEIKQIIGYERCYSITSFGQVWSHTRKRRFGKNFRFYEGRFKKLNFDRDGYKYVNLYKNGKSKTYKVHKLVAQYYIPNPNNLLEVNHKDGNKQNNFAGTEEKNYEDDNLEWCTHQENVSHAMESNLRNKNRKNRFYGVYKNLNSKRDSYIVKISFERKQLYLGSFGDEIEDAKIYNNFVKKHKLNKSLNKILETF